MKIFRVSYVYEKTIEIDIEAVDIKTALIKVTKFLESRGYEMNTIEFHKVELISQPIHFKDIEI